ncbi:hypothetical protein [Cytobacillus oceanisediminis]|nr:hypothetical protein [Cytobacillus oceanisediminis]
MENEFCICEVNKSVYSVVGDTGYWLHCAECEKKIEDGFHYYDEPEGVY